MTRSLSTPSSLEEIPSSVLTLIIRYLSDPQSLCAMEQSCKTFQSLCMSSGSWGELYRARWKSRVPPKRRWKDSHYKDDYHRRHLIDAQLQLCIDSLMVTETTERQQVIRAVSQIMSFGTDAMDVCWKCYMAHKTTTDDDDKDDHEDLNRKELIAICLLRSVHCAVVFDDVKNLCTHNSPIFDDDDDPGAELEEYAITSSRMFFDIKQGPDAVAITNQWIRQQLDNIATQVKTQIKQNPAPPQSTSTNTDNHQDPITLYKLQVLNTVFFDTLNFSGNTDNYYDFHNSMMHTTLRRKTAIPMTLAVLYKCIARRIGVQVDIIGLPGHIVIGVPALDRYVDVFRKGQRFLTRTDCERIVHSYGHVMVPEFMQPLTPAQVFRRILNNCNNCLAQVFPPNASKRMAIEAMRAILINPTQEQLLDCLRWFSTVLWGNHSSAHLHEMSRW
ncbi:Inherit from COG: F-box protein 21 [Seminavis robusta]|uniref:Inherit from COG: F-box protein 21 n=1 Tax=Seminavis robusta TaxID=568900 RepID=A0A9N8DCK5_9STRA|nr:Inherit from COG: F-box protein 21 [Seminavis robusta]|eukprot:Sro30_g019630.1 Inherit from COG: F-box protein 21 (444) ;mRNA; f:80739-82070